MRLLWSVLLCVFCVSSVQADVILFEDFEDNTLTFTTNRPLFHDGLSDYFTIAPLNGAANTFVPFSGFTGSNFFAVEDIDDGNTRPTNGTLSFNANVTGFTSLFIDLDFAAGGNDGSPAYDTNDGFIVRASLDGGAFQNLLAFESVQTTNGELRQDADFDGLGDAGGFLPSTAFTTFSNLAIAGTGSNLLVEVSFDSNDGNGEFAIDQFSINGTNAIPEPTAISFLGLFGLGLVLRRRRR